MPLKDLGTLKKVLEPLTWLHATTYIGKSSISAGLRGKADVMNGTLDFRGPPGSDVHIRLDVVNSIILRAFGNILMLDIEFFDKRTMQIHAKANMPKDYYSILDTLQDD